MPAIIIGVSEIEKRLQRVVRRLNVRATIRAGCAVLSALFLIAAVAVWRGIVDAAGSFTLAVSGFILCTGGCGVTAFLARRRWSDLPAAAILVDRTAQLSERLTTLVALRRQGITSRFMPVLVAQSVASMPHWSPHTIVPPEMPRSGWVFTTSILLLAISIAFRPTARPPHFPELPGSIPSPPENAQPPITGPAAKAFPLQQQSAAGDGQTDPQQTTGTNISQESQMRDAGGPAPPGNVVDSHDSPPRLMPHQAHSRQNDGQQTTAGLSGRNRQDSGPLPQQLPDRKPGPATADPAQRKATEDTRQELTSRTGPQPNTDTTVQHSPSGVAPSSEPGRKEKANTPDIPPSGGRSAAQAGGGTDRAGILDPHPAAKPISGTGTPETFQLTITSFLQTSEARHAAKTDARHREPATTAGTQRSSRPVVMPRGLQQPDDPLRKTEVPAQYEDVVRRVYSARTQP